MFLLSYKVLFFFLCLFFFEHGLTPSPIGAHLLQTLQLPVQFSELVFNAVSFKIKTIYGLFNVQVYINAEPGHGMSVI